MDQCAVDELYEAFSVLAGSDPDHCSYPKGYMKRQAVFACNTCVQAGMEPAGVCLACANTCHDGHDICELYTKRNFRCDCGNEKFHGFKCKLDTDKEGQNVKNWYNHNYLGRYCSCDRPYPDEDDQVNEEMIQCIVCEDWFHEKHLQAPAVDCEALMEMICGRCMTRAPFLQTYAAHFAVSPMNKESLYKEQTNADMMTDEKGKCSYGQQEETTAGAAGRTSSPDSVTAHSRVTECVLNELKAKDAASTRAGAVFWPYFWRAKLCTCTDCKRMYVKTGVPFLLDESDTLLAYEEKAKAEALTSEELLMSCITSLNHVQQLEIIHQYNDLKHELREFLQQSANQRKDVTPEAFHEFLEELQTRKKRRLN
ncbi:putative E3 ubiquitin-protein ligase UBR7 [Sinocyclocheilus anshuiensis]|uniref:putative E3 ubiquitin-protein ligase UBR7 n=1 Tax=Sinocyclocheilus anshuiensis TaxID=1608454 RepID=UPI0007B917D2|nr:PREDICTED: putative E3 ubiquitin-protein ligase UBR7 [Sinocyclocheilus anshuiensis]